jgi:hypothetical protein
MTHESHFRVRTVPTKRSFLQFGAMFSNRKSRVIASVIAVYLIIGFGVGNILLTPSKDQANANLNSQVASQPLPVITIEPSPDSTKLSPSFILKISNQSESEDLKEITADFYSTDSIVKWEGVSTDNLPSIPKEGDSLFKIGTVKPKESINYNIKASITQKPEDNYAVVARVKYISNESAKEVTSNRIILDTNGQILKPENVGEYKIN